LVGVVGVATAIHTIDLQSTPGFIEASVGSSREGAVVQVCVIGELIEELISQ